jgi:hypothetical protein
MTQWSTCQHFKIRQAAMPLQKEDLSTKEWAANGLGIEPFIKIYGNPHKDRKLIRGISLSYFFGHDYWTFNGVTMVSPLLIIHLLRQSSCTSVTWPQIILPCICWQNPAPPRSTWNLSAVNRCWYDTCRAPFRDRRHKLYLWRRGESWWHWHVLRQPWKQAHLG